MRLSRDCLARLRRSGAGIALAVLIADFALAQPATADRDNAMEAMKREAAAQAKSRDKLFARLKAMPAAVPLPAQAAVAVPAGRADWYEAVQTDPDDGNLDPDAPPETEPVLVFSEEAFESYLFGRGDGGERMRANLNERLTGLVQHTIRRHGLSTAEQRKLRLAGRADIKRLFDTVDEKRHEWNTERMNINRGRIFLDELAPLRIRMRLNPFDNGSLFAKVHKRILAERTSSPSAPSASDEP